MTTPFLENLLMPRELLMTKEFKSNLELLRQNYLGQLLNASVIKCLMRKLWGIFIPSTTGKFPFTLVFPPEDRSFVL